MALCTCCLGMRFYMKTKCLGHGYRSQMSCGPATTTLGGKVYIFNNNCCNCIHIKVEQLALFLFTQNSFSHILKQIIMVSVLPGQMSGLSPGNILKTQTQPFFFTAVATKRFSANIRNNKCFFLQHRASALKSKRPVKTSYIFSQETVKRLLPYYWW